MNEPILRRFSKFTLGVFVANLVLVPTIRAQEASHLQAQKMNKLMFSSGAMSSNWNDIRKSMLTLKQRVKDSRLDLELNGIARYREKAHVMVDLERQRLRRASRYLFDNQHKDRLVQELRDTGAKELVELANHIQLSTMADSGTPSAAVDNYVGYRMTGYEQAVKKLDAPAVTKIMKDTESAVDEYLVAGGDVRRLNKGLFADGENDPDNKGKLMRWIVGAIAGVGLIIAVFFSVTTMTMTPFLTFMATVVGLLALLGRNGAFQSIFYGNPYGPTPGPYNPYNPWNPYWPPQGNPGWQPPGQG